MRVVRCEYAVEIDFPWKSAYGARESAIEDPKANERS